MAHFRPAAAAAALEVRVVLLRKVQLVQVALASPPTFLLQDPFMAVVAVVANVHLRGLLAQVEMVVVATVV
jgi:hypothetical protein